MYLATNAGYMCILGRPPPQVKGRTALTPFVTRVCTDNRRIFYNFQAFPKAEINFVGTTDFT
jgi:hypothetical protein